MDKQDLLIHATTALIASLTTITAVEAISLCRTPPEVKTARKFAQSYLDEGDCTLRGLAGEGNEFQVTKTRDALGLFQESGGYITIRYMGGTIGNPATSSNSVYDLEIRDSSIRKKTGLPFIDDSPSDRTLYDNIVINSKDCPVRGEEFDPPKAGPKPQPK